ncbi:DNA segregation ATPase, FtsK/SpoIIIE family [Halobacteroides halobius DSM 5150]|uniref:DNA segregation ATPase, FtsK/SpoIIIE family n=1 Tax=Halobacteroides halobius (strain ATCC 35273 / DSM 5150 / MD-1) TaxID=748449 RepID=L0K9B9_HALHC|nr:DNA translocase FtsK [Halobacteroides halobius]AGB40708.1 DNA segregation ATPase, FtsK/SpoIIIE family [Halobacteroides halobius DSM 5150]
MKEALNIIIKKRKFELAGFIVFVVGILAELSFFTNVGVIGSWIAYSLNILFGQGRFFIPIFISWWGIAIIYKSQVKIRVSSRYVGTMILFIVFLAICHLGIKHPNELKQALAGETGGGLIGGFLLYLLRKGFADLGSKIILLSLGIIGFLLVMDILLANVIEWFRDKYHLFVNKIFNFKKQLFDLKNKKTKFKKKKGLINKITNYFKKDKSSSTKKNEEEKGKSEIKDSNNLTLKSEAQQKKNSKEQIKSAKKEVAVSQSSRKKTNKKVKQEKTRSKKRKPNKKTKKQQEIIKQAKNNEDYQLPPLSLLNEVTDKEATFVDKTQILQQTLDNFGVNAKITDVHCGPTITRYEIQPAPGVKVSKIVNLADDIALSLAASDVRIEAPIPGKAAVGIEVPNNEQTLVTLREVLASDKFKAEDSKLTIGLGNDIAGESMTADLAKMPHMLVAGATGSGKSVFINSIINSILRKATPKEVKFLLVDPKMVELTAYQGIPHLVSPVVTDAKKAATALRWVVKEMENRYELFAGSNARGIESYNQKIDDDPLPYVVVIIDELADLMMVSASEVEDAICRLAQKARAAGIHMILATQRPSVDVVTGVIKANIPTRVSFSLSSQADSRTILDTGGAEKLLGQGDMLFAPVGSNQPIRLQGAFISEDEVKKMVKFVKEQAKPNFADQIADIKDSNVEIELDDEKDDLYEEAVKLVVNNRASISFLQRKLSIGYNRAARMIDKMEEENIVGPHRGSKAREVLISKEELNQMLKE